MKNAKHEIRNSLDQMQKVLDSKKNKIHEIDSQY